MNFFSEKLIKQFAILTMLIITLQSQAVDRNYRDENSHCRIKLPIDTITFVVNFLEEREIFILARWHKSLEERKYILESSSNEKKNIFFEKLETYQQHKKKLRLKKERLYKKFVLRTCLFGTQLLIKSPLWFALAADASSTELCPGQRFCVP